jgi:hypothetical protein
MMLAKNVVCVRGGPNQPLHRDPHWSIVLKKLCSTSMKNLWDPKLYRVFLNKYVIELFLILAGIERNERIL